MYLAARGRSAERSTYTGTLPGPTPYAGLPTECAARTMSEPPVARMTATYLCFINSCVPGRVTFVMQETSPFGIPARSPASAMMRAVSAQHFAANGCGATTIAFLALTEINILYMTVEVGFVLGVNAATTPIGQAMSYVRFWGSLRITPTVGISLIASHNNCDDNRFFKVLCSGTP